jgi:hypothetical protein
MPASPKKNMLVDLLARVSAALGTYEAMATKANRGDSDSEEHDVMLAAKQMYYVLKIFEECRESLPLAVQSKLDGIIGRISLMPEAEQFVGVYTAAYAIRDEISAAANCEHIEK